VADDGNAARRWVGSGSLSGHFGLWGFSGPFIVVEIARSRVTVRVAAEVPRDSSASLP
jgi:hypothetical protein